MSSEKEASPKDKAKAKKEEWIVQGLTNLVPKVPKRSNAHSMDDANGEDQLGHGLGLGESHPDLTEREKDYREWLAESVELHHGALMNLAAEIETEDDREDTSCGAHTPGSATN